MRIVARSASEGNGISMAIAVGLGCCSLIVTGCGAPVAADSPKPDSPAAAEALEVVLAGPPVRKMLTLYSTQPARIEAIERDGGNSFAEYMLPHAALRLKQGFGRLVRARTDRGAVVMLDRRVLERGYGRYLLEALPPARVHTGPWAELRERLRHFYLREEVLAVAGGERIDA